MLTPRHILTIATVTASWFAFSVVASTPSATASEALQLSIAPTQKPAVHTSLASRTITIPAPLGPVVVDISSSSEVETEYLISAVTPADPTEAGTGVSDPPPEILASQRAQAVLIEAPPADLSLSVGNLPTLTLDESDYIELTVTNDGPSEVGSVEIVYTVPVGVEFSRTMANLDNCAIDESEIRCSTFGPLAAGSSTPIRIPVVVHLVPAEGEPLADGEASIVRSSASDYNTANDTLSVAPILR